MKKANTVKKTTTARPAKRAQSATKTAPAVRTVTASATDLAELLLHRLNQLNMTYYGCMWCKRIDQSESDSHKLNISILSGVVVSCTGNLAGFFRGDDGLYFRRILTGVRIQESIRLKDGTFQRTEICEIAQDGTITLAGH